MAPQGKKDKEKEKEKEKEEKEKGTVTVTKNKVIPPVSSGRYPGSVRIWTTATILAQAVDQCRFLQISDMKWAYKWRGEGSGFPAKMCVYGEGRKRYQLIAAEVNRTAETADVIVLKVFNEDHGRYDKLLNKWRSNSILLINGLEGAQNDYDEDLAAISLLESKILTMKSLQEQ